MLKNNFKNKFRVIIVINNEYRDCREKFYINLSMRYNFEDLLFIMGDMINIDIYVLFIVYDCYYFGFVFGVVFW